MKLEPKGPFTHYPTDYGHVVRGPYEVLIENLAPDAASEVAAALNRVRAATMEAAARVCDSDAASMWVAHERTTGTNFDVRAKTLETAAQRIRELAKGE